MTAEYTPQTDNGTGFLVPIVKAVQHLHNLSLATGLELAMTIEVARSELDHALLHADGIADLNDIATEDTVGDLEDWVTHLREVRAEIQAIEGEGPDAILTKDLLGDARDHLKSVETEAWQILSNLDVELLGWEDTDAGRQP